MVIVVVVVVVAAVYKKVAVDKETSYDHPMLKVCLYLAKIIQISNCYYYYYHNINKNLSNDKTLNKMLI